MRPSKVADSPTQTGRFDYNEAGRLSSNRVKELLGGENCKLDQSQLEEVTNGLCAFADFAVTVFVEQRKQRKTVVSEQPTPMPELPAPVLAVM